MATMIGLLVCGSVFYPSLYYAVRTCLRRVWRDRLTMFDIYDVGIRCVSSIQAVMSCIVGMIIMNSCTDIMTDQSWLTNHYAVFMVPYFYYDTWAMYKTHHLQFPELKARPLKQQLKHFVNTNAMMMVHHVVLPIVFTPIVLYFREGKGDFFVGVFYLFEMAVPFIAARFIMVQLKLKDSALYVVVSLLMIVAFFLSRILTFPYLYWCYAQFKDIPLVSVPGVIPVKCNACCLFIIALQSYWMFLMVRGAFRVFYRKYKGIRKNS